MFHTKGFGSITTSSSALDLVALSNEALSISIPHKKSIIEKNTIRLALHRQTWGLRAKVRSARDHGTLFYQIGGALVQNRLISNNPIESIYIKRQSCQEAGFSFLWPKQKVLRTWNEHEEIKETSFSFEFSGGPAAQDLWSSPGTDEKKWIASYVLAQNDSSLSISIVHGLLEVEGALVQSLPTEKDCSQVDNNRVPLLRRSEPRNPLEMF